MMDAPDPTPPRENPLRAPGAPDLRPGQPLEMPEEETACWVCGGQVIEHHCKIICQVCGFTRDCSDP
jgi:hypothetical protein